jgi:hypothetical protein
MRTNFLPSDHRYEIVLLDPEQFTSIVQMLLCCSNVRTSGCSGNHTIAATVRESNGGLRQLLALEQPGGRNGDALLSKNIDRDGKSFARIFFYVRSFIFRMVYCAATGSQYQEYMKLCLPFDLRSW